MSDTDDDLSYIDSDGDIHAPYGTDIEGVPYYHMTCGWDGEWWPCAAVLEQK